jgi:hypothetical protein
VRSARVASLALAIAVVTFVRPALAHDPERAADLFREGRDALNAGDFDTACGKFSESESLDPRVGTLINLAICEEGRHKVAAAHRYWQQATDFARATSDPRTDYCTEQLTRMERRVPRLTIRLQGAAPPDTQVARDGVELGTSGLGLPLPVEVGHHVVTARAAHHAPHSYDVELPEAESLEIQVAPGELLIEPSAPAPSTAGAAEERSPGPLRSVAYATAGLGIVALGVGTAFGLHAISSGNTASAHCDGDACDATGASARLDEQSAGNAATWTLVTGAALLTTGVALRVLSPSEGERPYEQRNLGYVAGAAGLVAIGVGAFFGLRAIGAMNDSSSHCRGNYCDHVGAADRRDAITQGNVSTVALATGGVLLAGGVTLWLMAPKPTSSSSGQVTGVQLGGTW